MDQNRCKCGRPAACGKAWCRRCLGVRDREMTHCMVRIRLATGLELSREDSEKLAQSYFKRRGNNEQDTLEEAE